MRLHQVLGRVCAVFAVIVFTFNVFTPSNPDHWLNLAETLALSILFIAALMLPAIVAKTLHVLMFTGAATIAVFTDTGFYFSAFITVATFVLIYAYGGFETMRSWKLPLATVAGYGVCISGVLHYEQPSAEAFSRAAVWELGVVMFIVFLWIVLKEILRKFLEKLRDELLEQNHNLLVELRNKEKRCDDGPTK